MLKQKSFYLHLKVTQDKGGDYSTELEHIDFLSNSTLTNKEIAAIKEGCILMAKELTQQHRKQIAEAYDDTFA